MSRVDWWFIIMMLIALIALVGLAFRPCYSTFAAASSACPNHFVDNITDVGRVVNFCC